VSRYATPSDLRVLGLPSSALASVSAEDVQTVLDAASQKADSYLGSVFRLPLTAWGPDLTLAVCQISGLLLMTVRGFNPAGLNETIVEAAKTGQDWLRDVSKGIAKPAGVSDTSPAASSVSRVTSNAKRGW